MLRSLLLACAVWTLAACAPMLVEPRLASNQPGPADFDGIDSLLTEQGLDVLLVHGMCSKDQDWARQALAELATLLNTSLPTEMPKPTVLGPGGIELHQATLQTTRGPVRANAVLWSPLTRPLKQDLCYDQSHKSSICSPPALDPPAPAYGYPRARLNRALKDMLLNDCLADALAYQGAAHEAFVARMQEALLQALDSSGATTASATAAGKAQRLATRTEPLVVITSSLGSKMVFDALLDLVRRGDALQQSAARRTYDRIATVFMRANQIPMLALADTALQPAPDKAMALRQPSARGAAPDPIAALEENRQRPPPRPSDARKAVAATATLDGRLQLVAFTDPNDVLSYVLVPGPIGQNANYRIVDVVLSTAPTLLGLVASPLDAHQDYDSNASVARFIACGTTDRALCQLAPR